MSEYIIRTLDGEKYWVHEGGIVKIDYDRRVGSVRAVNEALTEALKESEQLRDDLVSEVESIKRFLKTPNKTLDSIYTFFEQKYLNTRFEDIKNLSKKVLELIESVEKFEDISVFTRQKRITFIKNLRRILSDLGYSVYVEDFGNNAPIIVAVKNDASDDKLILLLDAKAYGYIESTSILRELMEDDEIVQLLSEEKKRSILRKLKKLSP